MKEEKETKVEALGAAPKKQKVSATYTLRSAKENLKKLNELGLITVDEYETMKEYMVSAVTRYVTRES